MRKKCNKLALWCILIALAIYIFSWFLYHYMGPDGHFGTVYQTTPGKPVITLLFSIWGVMFQFASVMSLLIGKIFFSKE